MGFNRFFNYFLFLVCYGFLAFLNNAYANVILYSTRVVYSAEKKEATIRTENSSDTPSLVQVWVDDGDASVSAQESSAPFVVTPPLIRLEPNAGQTFRIIYIPNKENTPKDKESVFYFNLMDIPPVPTGEEASTGSYLQFAYRSRIKLFYRPAGLSGTAFDAPKKMKWEVLEQGGGDIYLEGLNESDYHISFSSVKIEYQGKEYDVDVDMVSPKSSQQWKVKNLPAHFSHGDIKVNYSYISDYGSLVSGDYIISN